MTQRNTQKTSWWRLYHQKIWSHKKHRTKFTVLGTSLICWERDLKWFWWFTWVDEEKVPEMKKETCENMRKEKLYIERQINKDSLKKTILGILRAGWEILCWGLICTPSAWFTWISVSIWDISKVLTSPLLPCRRSQQGIFYILTHTFYVTIRQKSLILSQRIWEQMERRQKADQNKIKNLCLERFIQIFAESWMIRYTKIFPCQIFYKYGMIYSAT